MKTVLEKLGHRAGVAGWVVARPDHLRDTLPLPSEPPNGPVDLIVAFVTMAADLPDRLRLVVPHYVRGGRLWFCYPKKSGAIRTDISRDTGWQPVSEIDLLPVTQIAIDHTWSALRFRYRDEIAKLTRAFGTST